jgi:hypothetical protein
VLYFWTRLGSKRARCAVLLNEGVSEVVESPLQGVGERERFEHALLPHLDAAYNLACWLTRDDHDAEDLVQTA